MKAFLVGLIFLIATAVLTGIGILLFPVFMVLGFLLRLALVVALSIFAVWILGKFIIFVWENIRTDKHK